MSRASDISDSAAEWLIRLEGQTSPQMWDLLQAWIDEDPRHHAAFIRLRVAWNRVDVLKNMRPADGSIDANLLSTGKVTPKTVRVHGLHPLRGTPRRRSKDLQVPGRGLVLAAAAAIAIAGVFAWFGSSRFGWNSYETGIGGREQLALQDGSTVDLNTNTELSARLSGSERYLMLSRGEALFHVVHDATRPFYVTAGGTVVRAVGTAFSVRIRDAMHVDVLVVEGRVAVGASGAEANFENPLLLGAAPKVSAGQAATVLNNAVSVRNLAAKDMTRKLAWTTGRLAFQGETLENVVQEFNRYNQRKITIADPSLMQLQIGGTFQATDPESFVAALRRSFGIQRSAGGNDGEIRLIASSVPP